MKIWKPDKQQIAAAKNKRIPDIVAPDLQVIFVGINPGLYSAAVGHNFARPGNKFWPAIFRAGFTDRLLSPFEEQELLRYGCGITNIASRATATASELSPGELRNGARLLVRKMKRLNPRCVAIVGISAYRVAFDRPKARLGLQEEKIANSMLWIVPNPSGLNAHYQLPAIVEHFGELRKYLLPVRDI